jgi:two-component system, OmpR family, phosphate regulon sensor histidine kinase PhoR
MTFARRLVLGTCLVAIICIATLVLAAERGLRSDLETDIGRQLEREARMVRASLPTDSLLWQERVRALAEASGHRITLVERSGRVRADSDFPPGPLPPLENHATRPEVRGALTAGHGLAVRRSVTVGRDLMYFAVAGGPGVIRVAADLSQVDTTVRRAQRAVLLAALLALAVGVLLALVGARSITRPLTEIGAAARAIADGSQPRFPHSGIADVDQLVAALRQMHGQLTERFTELKREKAESAALVESMIEGVIAADARGRIVTANGAARRLLGYPASGPLPPLPELFRARAAREIVTAALGGRAEQASQLEVDGRSVLITARALPEGGALLVLHEITEMRRLEAVRRDFVANVSHELKTPLTSISGYAETLLTDPPDAVTTQRFLETILNNARRMQRLVDDLLDLSRIESGRWTPARESVDIRQAAADVWADLAERTAARDVAFEVRVASDAAVLNVDPDALRQILTNLLDNSLRYSSPGGRITVRTEVANGGIALRVEDTGSGIPHEHLSRIFERFYRADASRSRDEGGTGLGLAIVKHLVEAHGGRVSAESERGQGTAIVCWFDSIASSPHSSQGVL